MRYALVGILMFGLLPAFAAAESPVATVGSRAISRAELEQHVRSQLLEIERQRYGALREGLDELIGNELLAQEAKARGISAEALAKQEIENKVGAPADEEIQKLYDDNKAQLGNQAFDSLKPRLVAYLQQQRAAARREAFLGELRGKYKTVVTLRPPVVEVGTGSRPARGGKKAAVTIVEFSDYECPFCKRAEESVEKVLGTYGDQVRFVYRDYPLPFHANARPAAEAAHCANAQDKFWEYHTKLMTSQDLSTTALQGLAGEVGLDRAKFDDCVAKRQFKDEVEKDIADASKVGINGTPAFFINGRLLDGAQPFEKFKEIIDEELAWAKQGRD